MIVFDYEDSIGMWLGDKRIDMQFISAESLRPLAANPDKQDFFDFANDMGLLIANYTGQVVRVANQPPSEDDDVIWVTCKPDNSE